MRLVALVLLAAAAGEPAARREVLVREPGRTSIELDRHVYEHARADLGDLRVVDAEGHAVPYVLDRAAPVERPVRVQPEIRNRSFDAGESASATLEFDGAQPRRELHLRTSGDNFRRRVKVEGRARVDEEWSTLVDDAWIFAVPPPNAARYETVRIPESNHPLLRVTVFHAPDDPARIEIEEAWTEAAERTTPPARTVPVSVQRSRDARSHETHLVLDLGARYQPFAGVDLDVGDPRFFRGVIVESTTTAAPEPPIWEREAESVVYRMDEAFGDRAAGEKLSIDLAGRARRLRLRILDRDDAPLRVQAAAVRIPQERLAFQAAPGRSYRLTYGLPELAPPVYDLSRTVGDVDVWVAGAATAALEPPSPVSVAGPPPPPWTERHPALLWIGLVLVVGLLGLVTWRALAAVEA